MKSADTDTCETIVLDILRVSELLTRIGNARVFGKELTQAQFNVLMVLKRHGENGLSQKEILENLVSTKGNVSIHITNLQKAGFIRKKTSTSDGRTNIITLTAKGGRILDELEPKYIEQLRKITDSLPAGESATIARILEDIKKKCETTLHPEERCT